MHIDSRVGKPGTMIVHRVRADDMEILFSLVDAFLEERRQHVVFRIPAVEESTDVEMFDLGACQG